MDSTAIVVIRAKSGTSRKTARWENADPQSSRCGSWWIQGGFKVVGPGNLILFTVHTVDKGKPLYDWAK
jgi:hypothetical protein